MDACAVVVPIYRRRPEADEEVSLAHLEAVLAGRPRFFAAPEGLDVDRPGYEVVRFPATFFASVASYSRLLLDPAFYRAFADFEHILVYQLDCLVFRDELAAFTAAGFDYLGAPWLADRARPELGFSRVGNGGLSLRRVAGALRVLEGRRRPFLPRILVRLLSGRREPLSARRKLRVAREVARGVDWYRQHYSLNEDLFWADRAPLFDPCFRVADVATGLAFSFDEAPRACYDRLGRLPMGCHGWTRRDRAFWEDHLLPGAVPRSP